MNKIVTLDALQRVVEKLRKEGRTIVFTNGCFDLLHPGHVTYLSKARHMGDVLVVGLNSDRSVQEIKGRSRPILNQHERCQVMAALESVDFVTVFDEDNPLQLIKTILPNVLVKGGDWELDEIVGRTEVEAAGGRVVSLPYEPGQSTTGIIQRILELQKMAP